MMMSLSLTCEPCRYKLYTINCLVERSWRFGLPLVLAGINGKIMFFPAYLACFSRRLCCPCIVLPASLMPEARSGSAGGFQTVAVVGFFSPLAVMALGPWCGQLLDLTPRRTALRFIAVVQFAAIVTAGKPLLCSALWATLQNTSVRILPTCTASLLKAWLWCTGLLMVYVLHLGPSLNLQRSSCFPVLLCCTMVERLSAFASDIAIERDWITQVQNLNQAAVLEH